MYTNAYKVYAYIKSLPPLDFHQTSVHICGPAGNFATLSADLEDGSIDGPYPPSSLQEMVYMLEPCLDIFLNNFRTRPERRANITSQFSPQYEISPSGEKEDF